LNSKKRLFADFRSTDSTTIRKEITIGAADGVRHKSEEFDTCLAGAKIDPNMHDNADVFKKVKLVFKDTVTSVPPR
jgi:hypothetical protein